MCARKSFVRDHERTQKSARQIRRRVGAISRAARQIRRRVGVISRAGRWLWKVVVSHENGYIQAWNDPTASRLLLTISVCTKIVCKSSWTHAKICSTNKATSRRYFSSSSTNKRRVGVISRAGRWLWKVVVSHENGYIQAWNDPTASHLLLTISVCTKIVCKRSWTHAKICSTNKATSRRYFSKSYNYVDWVINYWTNAKGEIYVGGIHSRVVQLNG